MPDSALSALSLAKNLSQKINFKSGLAESHWILGAIWHDLGNNDSARYIYEMSLREFQESGNMDGIAKALISIGSLFSDEGDYYQAIVFYNRSVEISKKSGNDKQLAIVYGNMGNIYKFKGDYNKSIDSYLQALRIFEKIGKKKGVAYLYISIGNLYGEKGDNEKGLENFFKAEKLINELGDKKSLAAVTANVGAIYHNMKLYEKASVYMSTALKMNEEIRNKEGIALSLHNIAALNVELGKMAEAEKFYLRALKLREEIQDLVGASSSLTNLGKLKLNLNKAREAKEYFNRAIDISKTIGAKKILADAYGQLARVDSCLSDFRSAYEHHKLFLTYCDSIQSVESEKLLARKEAQFEFEKKESIQKLEQEKKDALAKEELSRQTSQRNAFIAGFALMLGLAGLSYRSYLNKRNANAIISRQKQEVELQKHLVEEKQKEIMDSINYARRIQNAILPSKEALTKHLKNGFVIFSPKDVVSGDFYWMERAGDRIFIAAADCTGHGVPGAMVSVVCANVLSKAILEEHIFDPGKILDRSRDLVIERFSKSGDRVMDGMDISLASLVYPNEFHEHSKVLLDWAGANNPIWIVKDLNGKKELIEIKADKQPVGNHTQNHSFTTHRIDLSIGDTIYIFTDGFADQFGGLSGKKLKAANFKKLILSVQDESMDRQKEIITQAFYNWKGKLEQVDDVCVIGIRI